MRSSKFLSKFVRSGSDNKPQEPPNVENTNVPNRLLRLIMMKHYKAATERLDFHPKEASTWIRFDNQGTKNDGSSAGSLPIHVACLMLRNRSTMVEVEHLIERLIQEYPTGCECVSQNGTLPIHIACLHGASPKIVKLMLIEYHGSVDVRDGSKKTPLQCAKAFRADRKRRKELIDLLKFAEKNKLGEAVVHTVHETKTVVKPMNEMRRMEKYMSKRVLDDIDDPDDTGDNDKGENAGAKEGGRPDFKKQSAQETPFRNKGKFQKFVMATLLEKSEEIKEKEDKEKEETVEDLSPQIQEYKDQIKELELKAKQLTGKNMRLQVENTVLKKKNNQLMKQSLSLKMKNATNILKMNTMSRVKDLNPPCEKSDDSIQVTKETKITFQFNKQVNSTVESKEPSGNPQQNDQKYIESAPSEKSDSTSQGASSEEQDTTPINQQTEAEPDHDYSINDSDKDYAIYNLETQNKALMRVIGSLSMWIKYIEEEKVGPQRRWRYGVHQNLEPNVLNELKALLSGNIFLDAPVNTLVQAQRYENEIDNIETVEDFWDDDDDGDDDDDNGDGDDDDEEKDEYNWVDQVEEDYDDDDDDNVDIDDYWA